MDVVGITWDIQHAHTLIESRDGDILRLRGVLVGTHTQGAQAGFIGLPGLECQRVNQNTRSVAHLDGCACLVAQQFGRIGEFVAVCRHQRVACCSLAQPGVVQVVVAEHQGGCDGLACERVREVRGVHLIFQVILYLLCGIVHVVAFAEDGAIAIVEVTLDGGIALLPGFVGGQEHGVGTVLVVQVASDAVQECVGNDHHRVFVGLDTIHDGTGHTVLLVQFLHFISHHIVGQGVRLLVGSEIFVEVIAVDSLARQLVYHTVDGSHVALRDGLSAERGGVVISASLEVVGFLVERDDALVHGR